MKSRFSDIDLVIVREQTEGEYSALEHESVPGVVECLKVVTADKSRRIAKFAFDYATRHDRKKVRQEGQSRRGQSGPLFYSNSDFF